jgi:hypothetical protein
MTFALAGSGGDEPILAELGPDRGPVSPFSLFPFILVRRLPLFWRTGAFPDFF